MALALKEKGEIKDSKKNSRECFPGGAADGGEGASIPNKTTEDKPEEAGKKDSDGQSGELSRTSSSGVASSEHKKSTLRQKLGQLSGYFSRGSTREERVRQAKLEQNAGGPSAALGGPTAALGEPTAALGGLAAAVTAGASSQALKGAGVPERGPEPPAVAAAPAPASIERVPLETGGTVGTGEGPAGSGELRSISLPASGSQTRLGSLPQSGSVDDLMASTNSLVRPTAWTRCVLPHC